MYKLVNNKKSLYIYNILILLTPNKSSCEAGSNPVTSSASYYNNKGVKWLSNRYVEFGREVNKVRNDKTITKSLALGALAYANSPEQVAFNTVEELVEA